MDTLKDRMNSIVQSSYDLLCKKIVGGAIIVDNEASMQMQLGTIMKTLGQMYEFSPEDRFSIVLEHAVRHEVLNTWKSKGKARIDILLTLTSGKETCSAAIELKYFPKSEGETVTDNRFAMLGDIENLEAYLRLGMTDLGYFILYTTNKNYLTDTRSGVEIGNETPVTGTIESNNRTVNLAGSYQLHWDTYDDCKHCFLLQKVYPLHIY